MNRILTAVRLLSKTGGRIAIDGGSGTGKTTLAEKLAKEFSCGVVHTDDFFLPKDLRTEKRRLEVGGNIHYERFKAEVVDGIFKDGNSFYNKFDCMLMDYNGRVELSDTKLIIVEGVYSMHPAIGDVYDLKIFLKADYAERKRRICSRNPQNADMFFDIWMPLEEEYFSEFKIEQKSDIVLLT